MSDCYELHDCLFVVFNWLKQQEDLELDRVKFWGSFSDSFKDFRISMDENRLDKLIKFVSGAKLNSQSILSIWCNMPYDKTSEVRDSEVALIMEFKNFVVIDFLFNINRPIQIFNPSKVPQFFERKVVKISDILIYSGKNFSSLYKNNPVKQEGALIHDKNWKIDFGQVFSGEYFDDRILKFYNFLQSAMTEAVKTKFFYDLLEDFSRKMHSPKDDIIKCLLENFPNNHDIQIFDNYLKEASTNLEIM